MESRQQCVLLIAIYLVVLLSLCATINGESQSLRTNDILKAIVSSLKTMKFPSELFSLEGHSRVPRSEYYEEEKSPFIMGVNALVDAVGNFVRAILQTLGLIPEEKEYQHYYYSPKCNYY